MIAVLCALRVLFAVASVMVVFASSVMPCPARESMMNLTAEYRIPPDQTTGARPTGFERAIIDGLCSRVQGAGTPGIPAVEADRSFASIVVVHGIRRGDARPRKGREQSRAPKSSGDLSSSYPLNYPQERGGLESAPRIKSGI